MYIKEIKKNNTPNGKVFHQFQLSETYRINGKVKQKSLLYLGSHELLKNKVNHTIVAHLLESKIKNEQILSEDFVNIPSELSQLAEHFYNRFLQKKQKESQQDSDEEKEDNIVYEEVDLNTTQVFDCREIGTEWMCYEMLSRLGFREFLVHRGNMSDSVTLMDIIGKMSHHSTTTDKQPLIVIDAGIATESNLEMLRAKGYLYVCVSRSKPHKDYETDRANAIIIKDKRNNEIQLKSMDTKASKDRWVYVKSSCKAKKEDSMLMRSIENFEFELDSVKSGIIKKGGTKKADKVWERIGRIKERNKSVHKYYDIKVEVKDGMAVEVEYTRKEIQPEDKQSGEYYLRTNYSLASEEEIWDIYNTIREVESTFRCLKTDLRLRPVHHQEDRYCEAHLHLGLLAYQIVAPIRYMLKLSGIDYTWRNIVRIMNTQKVVSVSIKNKDKNEVIIRTCSRPTQEVLQFYRALEMSSMPFKSKKFVVHHLKKNALIIQGYTTDKVQVGLKLVQSIEFQNTKNIEILKVVSYIFN